MATATDPLVVSVGPRVRTLREAMDLSLRDLAERSGVSAPMLTQVERGETSPTLQVAARIAAGLELRLSQLLRLDEDGMVTVVRREERRRGGADGHGYEILTPPLPGQRAEVSRHTLGAGRLHRRPRRPADARARLARDGGRRGRRRHRCTSTARATSCARATAVTFDADLPHHFENPGREEAALLAVVSAGLRRS